MHVDLKEVEFLAASFNRLEKGLEMVFTVKISSLTATADIYRISGAVASLGLRSFFIFQIERGMS